MLIGIISRHWPSISMLLLPVAAWADQVLPYLLISYAVFGILALIRYRKK